MLTSPMQLEESIKELPRNLRPNSLLSTTVSLSQKVILKIVLRHIEVRGLLNECQFGFRARHRTILLCVRLTINVTLNLNSNVSMAAVFFGTGKALDTTWHRGLLCELSKLKLFISVMKLFIIIFGAGVDPSPYSCGHLLAYFTSPG
jgi:hypothetical protein